MAKLKAAVLLSGSGTNLQALIDASTRPGYGAEIVTVIANRPDAYGLVRAQNAGLPTDVVRHRAFADRAAFEAALHELLTARGAELVCLAGFMRVLSAWFVERWMNRLINIHPSLLPAFKGLEVHERVIAAGVRFTGCTVHYVRADVDAGPIIVQGAVPVHRDDTPQTLQARVLEAEHRCYPLAVDLIAKQRVRVVGNVVQIDGAPPPAGHLINPEPDRATS